MNLLKNITIEKGLEKFNS